MMLIDIAFALLRIFKSLSDDICRKDHCQQDSNPAEPI